MSDYEMISAVQGYQNIGMTVMLNFFSFVVAYLVSGYLVAHRLSLLMALFVTVLFLAVSTNSVLLMYGIGAILQGLLGHMHEVAVAGKGLAWTPLAKFSAPPSVWIVGGVGLTAMALATIGAVFFFFECRSRNRKAEVGG